MNRSTSLRDLLSPGRFARLAVLTAIAALLVVATPLDANAQYATAHRTFGGGTTMGGGFSRLNYQFPNVDANKVFALLPTLELKIFLSDALSIDFNMPVSNIAASSFLHEFFFVTGEGYVSFHPSAPSAFELFVSPGIGLSYASWESDDGAQTERGFALHVPVRIGFEINSARRNFSLFVAAKPFFSLTRGQNLRAGGGGVIEIGLMAYGTAFRGDRY